MRRRGVAIDLVGLPISVLPVAAFLLLLIVMDSYKLVHLRSIVATIVVGMVAAFMCLYFNTWLINLVGLDSTLFKRYGAPITEEVVKGLYIVYLLRAHKVGFGVDAAIRAVAVGTGFSWVENVQYLMVLGDESIYLWIVRGFGTAVLHPCNTAILAIISKSFADRREDLGPVVFLPGLALVVVVHSMYNHFWLPPFASMALILLVMPLLVIVVFDRSEKATRRWLGSGLDADMELHELIRTGEIREDRIGVYLQSLRSRFPGPVVADMLCLLQIQTELSMQAKALLMAREAGLELPVAEEVRANLKELEFLQKSIGPTGRLAIAPFIKTSSRDLWQIYMLSRGT